MTPAELAEQVRLLEITARHTVTEVFAGEYSSAFRGRGIEFSEVRDYQPGDDVRTIDWNVTARTGHPFVKRYTEERELTILLAVDVSASGNFGTQSHSKREFAARIAAVLGFAAARQGDRIGLILFTDDIEYYVPPKKGVRHALRLIGEMLAFEPHRRTTSLSVASDHIAKAIKRRSVIFMISDFLDTDIHAALSTITPRHDVIAVRIVDPRDRELVPAGLIEFEDPESGARSIVDTSSRRVREAFTQAAAASDLAFQDAVRRSGADDVTLMTDRPFVHELVELFHKREHRR